MQQCWANLLGICLSLLLALEHHQLLSISQAQVAVGGLTAAGNLLPAVWHSTSSGSSSGSTTPGPSSSQLLAHSDHMQRPKGPKMHPARCCTKDVPHRLPQAGCCNTGVGQLLLLLLVTGQRQRSNTHLTVALSWSTQKLHSGGSLLPAASTCIIATHHSHIGISWPAAATSRGDSNQKHDGQSRGCHG